MFNKPWIQPEWPGTGQVQILMTHREGGVSQPPYDCLNLGEHVGDDLGSVAANRLILGTFIPSDPIWLNGFLMVHQVIQRHHRLMQPLRPCLTMCFAS